MFNRQKLIIGCATIALLTGCTTKQVSNKDEFKPKNIPSKAKSENIFQDDSEASMVNILEYEIESKTKNSYSKKKNFKNNFADISDMDDSQKPYFVMGKWYYPTSADIGETFRGTASWYGPDFHGKDTSNGDLYDMYKFTAAHKTLPFNTILKVTNLSNNKSTVVRINDRGPFIGDRVIDLSYAAANDIGVVSDGTVDVKLEVIAFDRDPVESSNKYAKYISSQTPRYTRFESTTVRDLPIQTTKYLPPPPKVNIPMQSTKVDSKTENTKLALNTEKKFMPISRGNSDNKFTLENKVANIQKINDKAKNDKAVIDFAVQVGSYGSLDGAKLLSQKYKNMNSIVKETNVNGERAYKVLLSGFKDYDEAKKFIQQKGFEDAFVVVGNR